MSNKNIFSKGVLAVMLSIVAVGTLVHILPCHHSALAPHPYSLDDALQYYGFSSPRQKQAIQDLLQRSSIIPNNTTLKQAFPARKTQDELIKDIIHIVQKTQQEFVVRRGQQERWEVQALDWTRKYKDTILKDLRVLGFVDALGPQKNTPDAVCILGARASTMEERIKYVESLHRSGFRGKAVILLSGERYVSKDVDGTEKELMAVAKKCNVQHWGSLTETHLIKHAFHRSALNNKDAVVHVIDTPRGDLPRPNTQTTIIELIKWLKKHKEVRNIVFISNQPYVQYQKAIIHSIFKDQNINMQYEVVGSASKNHASAQEILEGFGSYIWAKTPEVLSAMSVKTKNATLKDSLKALYFKNLPLYSRLRTCFA